MESGDDVGICDDEIRASSSSTALPTTATCYSSQPPTSCAERVEGDGVDHRPSRQGDDGGEKMPPTLHDGAPSDLPSASENEAAVNSEDDKYYDRVETEVTVTELGGRRQMHNIDSLDEDVAGVARLPSPQQQQQNSKTDSDADDILEQKLHPAVEEAIVRNDEEEHEEKEVTMPPTSGNVKTVSEQRRRGPSPGAYAIRSRPIGDRTRPRSRSQGNSQGDETDDTDVESSTNLHLPNRTSAPLEAELVVEDSNDFTKSEAFRLKTELEEIKKKSTTATIIKIEEGTRNDDEINNDAEVDGVQQTKSWNKAVVGLLLIVLIAIIVALVMLLKTEDGGDIAETSTSISSFVPTSSPTAGSVLENTALLQPTLQRIQERGKIRCRVESFEREQGRGLSLDLCRALSAAIFGNPDRTEYPISPWREQWLALHTDNLDVSTSQATFNMARDVYEWFSRKSLFFSTPWLISGIGFGGIPEYVDCAEAADTLTGDCRELVLCSVEASTNNAFVHAHFAGSGLLHLSESSTGQFESFIAGDCNVIVGERVLVYEQRARDAGYTGPYKTGTGTYSSEPLAIASRGDDPEWADFTNAVLQALITAEKMNITHENTTQLFPQTTLFGEQFKDMFRNAILAVGNWGQVYERGLADLLTRDGVNLLTGGEQTGGLLFVPPFGNLDFNPDFATDVVPQTVKNGTLESIYSRGRLRCGVIPNRPGFAALNTPAGEEDPVASSWWTGFDVDLCHALAASMFGDPGQVDFVPLVDTRAGFQALVADKIDVFAGAPYSLQNAVKEPSTGSPICFSSVYYYDNDDDSGEMLAMATSQEDSQWGDFVRWTVYALIYAEQNGLGSGDVNQMTSVDLFGPSYQLMFRLALLHVGNYADVYERNLEKLIPRSGYNLLNDGTTPLIHPLPIDTFQ